MNDGFRYPPFFWRRLEKLFILLLKIKVTLKFGNPSFKIGCSTVVSIFSDWLYKTLNIVFSREVTLSLQMPVQPSVLTSYCKF